MPNTYFIEEYKGQSIYYDEFFDKFVCSIVVEDQFKDTKRQSLKDVRLTIDQFVKENLNFKPFKAIIVSEFDKTAFQEVYISAIRTDGKLIGQTSNSSNFFIGKKQAELLRVYDVDLINQKEELYKEKKKFEEKQKIKQNELANRLKSLDLSQFNLK